MDESLIETANDLIARVNGNTWVPPADWNSVSAAFSERGRGKKYWKTYSRKQNILYFYGPLDFTVFFLPDTVVHQALKSQPALRQCIAFMEIPEGKLKRRNIVPPEEYLKRFQGIFANVFNVAILPCKGVGGNIENLNRMKLLFNQFSPVHFQTTQKQHDLLNQLAEEVKYIVTDTVRKEKRAGAAFEKERDVSKVLDPVVQSFFKNKGFAAAATQFKGLWRNPNCDHVFTKKGTQWPTTIFVELKCDVDIKAPLVQVSEDLAADFSAAVLQIHVPSKPTKEPELAFEAKKRMEKSVPVRYIEVESW